MSDQDEPNGADGTDGLRAPQRTRFADPVPAVDHAADEPLAEVPAADEAAAELPVSPPVSLLKPPAEAAPEPATVPVTVVRGDADDGPSAVPDLLGPVSGPDPTGIAPSRRGEALVPVLAAVVLVLAGLTGFLGYQLAQTPDQASSQSERKRASAEAAQASAVTTSSAQGLEAARRGATLVFSYDYRKLAKDFAAGRAVTTGQFQEEYDRTTKRLVDDVAPRYKAVVVAEVVEAAVVRASDKEVVCLVFVNQVSTSTLTPKPKITQSRLEMTLVRSGATWLVAKIDAL